jgi:hypothetical protein
MFRAGSKNWPLQRHEEDKVCIQQTEGCEAPFARDFLQVHLFRSGPRSECILSPLLWSQMDLVIMNQKDISEIHPSSTNIAQRAWSEGNGLWVWNCRGDWVGNHHPSAHFAAHKKILHCETRFRLLFVCCIKTTLSSTAIGLWKHRIPSDLRS